ncbi:MAG: ABC transporter ATP-binding protein [Bacteroidales bacterium]
MNKQQGKNQIWFDNSTKLYSNKPVLNKLSFTIAENEYVALIGNNGCGKTTTINVLCNLVPYEKGNVYVFGSKVTPAYTSYKDQLGIVLSTHYSIREFSIVDYLSFVGEFQFLKRKEVRARLEDLLRLFELEDQKHKTLKYLSSGNLMKVSIAAALIHNPKILVLDEPFANLDIRTIQTIIEIIKRFRGKKTVFITSHNIDLVVDLCDRFLLMENGRILTEINNNERLTSRELKEKIKTYLVSKTISVKEIDWLNLNTP